jgi:AcrR family transcriptional regulator
MAEIGVELFEGQGYQETTVAQTADAAQASSHTVFRLFPTKAAIRFDHLVLRQVTGGLAKGSDLECCDRRRAASPATTGNHRSETVPGL